MNKINWYRWLIIKIVFVIGGIGYNEVRSLMNNKVINRNLIVGSTFLLRPNDYVNELVKLNTLWNNNYE
jgi:cobalamin biosynthesis Co2+ chelatase CbiK